MKNPCRECVGHCTGTSRENCWQWIAYDRDCLARRVKRLEGMIVHENKTGEGLAFQAEAARIVKRGAK